MPLCVVAGPGSRYYAAAEGGGGSSLTVSASSSRTTGVAPFAVMVDAIATTSTDATVDTYRDVGYYHDYGESGLGTWPYSGEDRNIDTGAPVAAHVYETPGTFTYKVKGRDSSGGANDGDTDQDEITFTVTDPDTVYSGTNTVCISRTTDTTGAPAGAQLLTNQTSWPAFASNRRYLLRAGQDFSSFESISFANKQDMQIGKFGSGADPITSTIMVDTSDPVSSDWTKRITIYDLNVNAEDGSGYSILFALPTEDILILRGRSAGIVSFGKNNDYFFDDPDNKATTEVSEAIHRPIGTFVFEHDVGDTLNTSGRNIAAYGNLADGPTEHCHRFWQGYRMAVRHCRLIGVTDSARHNFKMHSAGIEEPYEDMLIDSREPASRYGVFAFNDVGQVGDANTEAVNLGPQSGQAYAVEGMEDFIVENNTYNKTYNHVTGLGGRRMTSRGQSGTIVTDYNIDGKPDLDTWIGTRDYSTGGGSITVEAPT